MNVGPQLLELSATLTPLVLACVPLTRPPSKIGAWVVSVLLTASMSILSMGLLMMRLTARCVSREVPCPDGLQPKPISPDIFARFPECSACLPAEGESGSATIAMAINGAQMPLATAGAVICTLISLAVLARFAAWVKRQGARR